MDYLDFELEILPGSGREYPVAVLRSPAGEGRETMRFPFDQLALESRLDKLQIALLRFSVGRRRVLSNEEQAVQDFGQTLFDVLFTGEIRSLYDRSRDRAEREELGLRLKLRVQAPELAALPWELLYDRRIGEFLVLSRDTPLLRYMELGQPFRPLTVAPPLRILGMIASPKDQEGLDVEREKERMERAIAVLRHRGLVELTWLEGQTWCDLQRALRGGPWHVFHFVGHGGFDAQADEGLVVMCGEDGYSHYLRATELARLLANQRSLRLVFLNACESGRGGKADVLSSTASLLVQRGMLAVLAMQYEITDRAAIELARSFYESLADGLPVDAAVVEARTAVSLAVTNSLEWCTPVLYMRTSDGQLFDLSALAVPAQSVVVTERTAAAPLVLGLTHLVLDSQTRLELVRVPAGAFLMGSDRTKDPSARDDELPQHKVHLPEFLIGKHLVTVAQFEAFVKATGHETIAEQQAYGWNWRGKWQKIKGANWRQPYGPADERRDRRDHPIVQVSWYDAKKFCEWVREITGRKVMLPSEAEWEKAARTPDGRLYPWGDQPPTDHLSNLDENVKDTTPVGRYSSAGDSLYGCTDMAGNVWEWTRSLWGERSDKPDFGYPYSSSDGREDEDARQGTLRVLRGGAWVSMQSFARCASRYPGDADSHDGIIGFRVVVSLSDSGQPLPE